MIFSRLSLSIISFDKVYIAFVVLKHGILFSIWILPLTMAMLNSTDKLIFKSSVKWYKCIKKHARYMSK